MPVAISENGVRPISRPTPSCAWATAFLEAQYRVRPCSQRESPCPAGPSAFRSPIERQTLFLRRTSRQVLLACIQAACDDCESPPQSPARFEWPCPHLPSIIIAIAIIAQEEKKNIAIAIKTALCVCDQHRDLRNRLAADAWPSEAALAALLPSRSTDLMRVAASTPYSSARAMRLWVDGSDCL